MLIVAGVLSLVEVGLTVFWQEPFSSLAAKGRQDEVRGEVERLLAAPVAAADARTLAALDDSSRLRFRAEQLRRSARTGKGIGRIEIPEIDVDSAFVEGTDGKPCNAGPGTTRGPTCPVRTGPSASPDTGRPTGRPSAASTR